MCVKIHKENNELASKTFTAEVQALLLQLEHPSIIQMLKVDVADLTIGGEPTGTRAMFTATELAVNGDLFGFVHKAGCLPEPVCRQYMN